MNSWNSVLFTTTSQRRVILSPDSLFVVHFSAPFEPTITNWWGDFEKHRQLSPSTFISVYSKRLNSRINKLISSGAERAFFGGGARFDYYYYYYYYYYHSPSPISRLYTNFTFTVYPGRGGATVIKIGGTISWAERAKKNRFLSPYSSNVWIEGGG